jgi:hypothetical protein
MESRDIARLRMRNQHLWASSLQTPREVVHRIAAMQAQEYPVAKWSVAQRTGRITDGDMDQAFADGTILRTHLLRPTWHFVLPVDIRWLQDLTAPRVHVLNAHYYRKLGLDDDYFAKSNALLAAVLEGGRHLTRKELGVELNRAGIEASGLRLGYTMMRAELDAVVCSGVMRGKQHTYALLDERAPNAKTMARDEALAELTRRYFTTRGPATLKDYIRWSSLTAAAGRRGLDMLGSELQHEVVDGRAYWFAEGSLSPDHTSETVDLVQVYDEVVMSYSESRDALTGNSIARDEAGYMHAVLLGGRWIGRWRAVRSKASVAVETSLDRPFNRVEARALETATERYARFLGMPVTGAPATGVPVTASARNPSAASTGNG